MSECWVRYTGAVPDDSELKINERLLYCPDCRLQTTLPKTGVFCVKCTNCSNNCHTWLNEPSRTDGSIIRSLLLGRKQLVEKYIQEEMDQHIGIASGNRELKQINRMLNDIRYGSFSINNKG